MPKTPTLLLSAGCLYSAAMLPFAAQAAADANTATTSQPREQAQTSKPASKPAAKTTATPAIKPAPKPAAKSSGQAKSTPAQVAVRKPVAEERPRPSRVWDQNRLIPPQKVSGWTFYESARLQADALLSSELPPDRQTDFDLRRARLSLLAKHRSGWRASVGADFSDTPQLQQLAVEFRGWPVWIEAGRVIENFGLADQTGSRDLAFMERPQPTALGGGFGLGVGASAGGSFWGASAGAYGRSGNPTLDGRDQAITARLTLVPLRGDGVLAHLGAGISLREPENGELRLFARPESFLVSGLSVQTAALAGVEQFTLYNAEAALRLGPVLLSGEWLNADFSMPAMADTPSYDGYYVEASWALTGEKRPYSTRRGIFGGLKPHKPLGRGGIGALEIAARHSQTDFSDPLLGGETGQVSGLALNWTPVRLLRLQLNALSIEEIRGAQVETDSVVQMRAQLSF